MAILTCQTCNVLLHARLRARLSFLASLRSRSQVRSHKYQVTPDPPKLAYHWDTFPPTLSQLQSATAFIRTHPPRKLWTATEWRKHNPSDSPSINTLGTQLIPEVTFLGRSNVGKSSLLNALLQSPELNRVGPRPGKTNTMHAWGLSAANPLTGGAGPGGEQDTRVAVLDMPGYGYASRDDWGKEIVTYLRRRKQLRRAFVLIDALHGIKASDEQMVKLLRKEGISYQIVVSKADRLLATSKKGGNARLQAFFELLRQELVQPEGGAGVAGLGEILAVGGLGDAKRNDKITGRHMLGIEQVRWAVLVAAGLEEWATKRTATSDKETRTANTETTSSSLPERLNRSPPLTPQSPSAIHNSILTTLGPPSTKGHAQDPTQHSSLPTRPTRTHRSSYPTTFRTHEEEARAARPPAPVPSTAKHYNPVGGLAELEAQSSRNSKEVPSSRRRKRGSFNDGDVHPEERWAGEEKTSQDVGECPCEARSDEGEEGRGRDEEAW